MRSGNLNIQPLGRLGVGTANPDDSSSIDASSSDRGLLLPRLTTAERDAVTTPTESLMIFNTTDEEYQYFDGIDWVSNDNGVKADFATIAGIDPSLDLVLTSEEGLPTAVDFTRASTGSYFDRRGVFQEAREDEARFDHDPVTGDSKGLLIEESRTNLVTYSEEFDQADWIKVRSSITADATTAPDGAVTADKLVENTDTSTHYFYQAKSSLTGTLTSSLFAKKGEREGVWVRLKDQTNSTQLADAYVNLTNGTVNSTPTGDSYSVEHVGKDWYRISLTGTVGTTITARMELLLLETATGTSVSYTGDGTSGLYFWGTQLEEGAFPTSYIPTTPTFTSRASTATYFDSSGVLQSAAVDEARYGYKLVDGTWTSAGLILEESRTNLLAYSSHFDNADWNKSSATITANVTTAPDGAVTADKLVEDTSSGVHSVTQGASDQTGTFTGSVFVKKAEREGVYVRLYDFSTLSNVAGVYVNLNDGTVNGTPTGDSYTVEHVGDDWYRISVTGTVSSTITLRLYCYPLDSATSTAESYAGDGTSGIYIWGAQLEEDAFPTSYIPTTPTFTSRASTATYFDSSGVLQSAAVDEARYGYKLVDGTWTSAGLILEDAATNLLTYSEEFDNADWLKQQSSITANDATAPDGTVTADKLVEDTSSSIGHNVHQSKSNQTGTFTGSVFVKKAEREGVRVRLSNNTEGTTLGSVYVNLNDGTVNGASTGDSYSVEHVGNDWYRISVTGTVSTTETIALYVFLLETATSTTNIYTGDGSSGIYVWGAQLEEGNQPTSYIPTTDSTVTRAADVSSSTAKTRAADVSSSTAKTRAADRAVMTGTNFSDWYNPVEGTVVVDGEYVSGGSEARRVLTFDDGTNDNRLQIFGSGSGLGVNSLASRDGSLVANISQNKNVDDDLRMAFAVSVDDFANSLNGQAVSTDSAGNMPRSLTTLRFGVQSSGEYLNGHIKRVTFFPKRIANIRLRQLTK